MFQFTDITTYHQDLLSGKYTCLQAVDYYLENTKQNQHLNAFVAVYTEEARQKAVELDDKRKQGGTLKKMHGVVIAIKDVICYKGHSVTAASAILKGFTSLYTASALQFLIDEDAIIIGNCNCDEFAMGSTNEHSVYGKVLNALDETRVPGGSSGGSAVAVQANMCMVSLGSDTGGSVRQPADFCGIIGFKPSYGRISRYGLLAYASSFDQIGIFGKSVEDISHVLEIMSRPDEKDATMLKSTLEVNSDSRKTFKFSYFPETLDHPGLDQEIRKTYLDYIEILKADGHSVEPVNFSLLEYIVPTYYVLTTAEASSNLSRYDGVRYCYRSPEATANIDSFYRKNRSEGFGTEVKRRIMLGSFVLSTGYFDAYFTKAQKIRSLLVEKMQETFAVSDALIMPTSPTTAMPIGAAAMDPLTAYLADIYTVFANLTGIPGISLPLFSHSNNLPFGLQLMASPQNEVTLLRISGLLMAGNAK